MKLVNPAWEFTIEFEENVVNVITIENIIHFRDTVASFLNQIDGEEGDIVLYSGQKELSVSKNVELIFNPFILDLNNKKIISKLYQSLAEEAQDETNYLLTQEMLSEIQRYLEIVIESCIFPIEYNENINLTDIFKAYNLKIENITMTLPEKISYYIELMQSYCGVKIFIFVNLKTLLTQGELLNLYKELNYKKINYFLLESNKYWGSNQEKQYVIDKDMCQIY